MKKTVSYFVLIGTTIGFVAIEGGCTKKVETESRSEYYTREIGIYPGSPVEDPSPELVVDDTYRNIAKWRAAYHSSSYDYNLTAQLVTDGIITSEIPATLSVSTSAGELKKNEREWLFDGKIDSKYRMEADDSVSLYLTMNNFVAEMDRMVFKATVTYGENAAKGYEITCYGSDDKEIWTPLAEITGEEKIEDFDKLLDFKKTIKYSSYRIDIHVPGVKAWAFSEWEFFCGDEELLIVPSHMFTSAWMSAGTDEEWLYVDLGTVANFDKVSLHWINKAMAGSILVSEDGQTWKEAATLPDGDELTDVISLNGVQKGRFVQLRMTEAKKGKPYILSELEIFGKGGLISRPKVAPGMKGNRWDLTGANWKLQRTSEVTVEGEALATTDFDDSEWLIATVPGTVLTSFLKVDALPNPNYGDNQLQISESFFNADFWYRNEFRFPVNFDGERIFLNFNGINWKADIFFNGEKVGRIEGAFLRGQFDVTDLVKKDGPNVLAVRIIKNAHIGSVKEQTAISADQNGGVLGRDNPTFHASIGWDWIPTIRGRNIGIWDDVFLTSTGKVTIESPFIRAKLPLPDTTSADLFIDITLRNHSDETVTGTLWGTFGEILFEQEVSLAGKESRTVLFDPQTHPVLRVENPRLWWPKGYGAPNLYEVELCFEVKKGEPSDTKRFFSGVRQMDFNEDGGILTLFINGRRFIGRGGNWGFSESNLNYRSREYDIAVAHHANMNFTLIRNWVGQTGDDSFYEACDKHGIMVWQDFWLANPWDGPVPDDNDLFMMNAEDFVKRIRNHPSIAIYVGRNEGNPPEALDRAIRTMLPALHPGIHYISNSAAGVVSGKGPYRALPPKEYYLLYGGDRFHSERGMPNVMTYESLAQTIPAGKLWPQNNFYGLHDYTLASAQSAATFNEMIEKAFGQPANARQFAEWAQWINYNGYRAMFEGRSEHRRGLLLWMSHPAWPSMVWQTYDYYFDPTAAYFACQKANEPLHIQWNPVWDGIEVVNYHARDRHALAAKAQLINMDGSIRWEKDLLVNSNEDSTVKCFSLELPRTLSTVFFIRLTLTEDGILVSDNFYWRSKEDGNYQALHQLPKTSLTTKTSVNEIGGEWLLSTTLQNETSTPALMIRLQVNGGVTARRILPVFFSDNFFSLMPGEKKTVTVRLQDVDTRGEQPVVSISGFNI
ncbi:MAG: discoidin domain-containing protein [Tannerellaceae bacterium]|jgi:hypothetical protein|nr:discoidin domain-containing protein [Tannerellaceae bacterium]